MIAESIYKNPYAFYNSKIHESTSTSTTQHLYQRLSRGVDKEI